MEKPFKRLNRWAIVNWFGTLRLTGFTEEQSLRILTSSIVDFNLNSGLVETKNSLYQLGKMDFPLNMEKIFHEDFYNFNYGSVINE